VRSKKVFDIPDDVVYKVYDEKQTLSVILKVDTSGSMVMVATRTVNKNVFSNNSPQEAFRKAVSQLKNDEVDIKIISMNIGDISESDVSYAKETGTFDFLLLTAPLLFD